MSNKLITLMCFVAVLGLAGNVAAQLDPATVTNGHVYRFGRIIDGQIPDSSANSHSATILGDPQIVDIPGGRALQLDGVDDGIHIPDIEGINLSTHTNHTVVAVFNCADVDKPEAQCVYEEGGSTRGLTIYVQDGMAWAGAWNKADYDPQWAPGTWISAPINSNEWVAVAAVLKDSGPGQEDDKFEMWMDGQFIGIGPGGQLQSRSDDNGIGTVLGQTMFNDVVADAGFWFEGMVDQVWILNDPVTEADLAGLMVGPQPVGEPQFLEPPDGTEVSETSVTLAWRTGDFAVSHNVYMGTNIDDVAGGTVPAVDAPQGTITAGIAGGPIPDGLVPGETYYWRVEAVNDLNPESPWTSDIKSLWLRPLEAMDPSPADGAKFVGPAVTLSWIPGFGATEHTVYIGDDFGAVSSATGGTPQTETTFDAGVLAKGTMYHWRVDESDGTNIIKGDVWSFETPPMIEIVDPNLVAWWKLDNEGFGVAVVDSSGYDHHGTIYGDPQWIDGYGGMAMDFDGIDDYVNIDGWEGILAVDGIQHAFSIANWFRIAPGASDGNVEMVTWGTNSGTATRLTWRVHQGRLRTEHNAGNLRGNTYVDDGEWHHGALIVTEGANLRVPNTLLYVDGVEDTTFSGDDDPYNISVGTDVRLGMGGPTGGRYWPGALDDVRIYDKALTADEVKQTMRINLAQAWEPQPADRGETAIWTALSWQAGDGAVEHDVYLGTDIDTVAAADASDTTGIYLGRQAETMVVPAGLAWTTQYYWRIDEVAEDGTITTGRLWSFTTTGEIVLYDEVTPFPYDTSADPFLSEISLDLDPAQDWTGGCGSGIGAIAISYDGQSAPGSVTEVDGVITVVGRGDDIWGSSDQFQYAHATLTGDGSMTVKLESLASTHDWTKAGIMIRESLDPGSAFAAIFATGNNGVRYQARAMANQDATADDSVATDEAKALTPPVWLKIERTFPMISAYYSTDGATWTPMAWNPQVIPMTPLPIYIGLAVTSHSGAEIYAESVFSNLSTSGGVAAEPLTSTEIGLESNSAEPMYLVLEDASGAMAAALNPDPAATQLIGAEWIVDLDEYNIDRAAVAKATLVIGDLDNPSAGGLGMLTINSVSLLPDCVPVGHWKFDDGSGTTAVDSSRGGMNDGTLVGDPQWAAGIVGGALDFDGVNDVVELGALDVAGQITLAVWIMADDFEINDARIITKAKEWGGNDHWWMISTISETSLRFRLKTDDGQDTATLVSDPVLEAGVWTHVAASWDGSMMRIYKDGLEVASQEKGGAAVAIDPAVKAAIGSQPSDAFDFDPNHVAKFFDGLIDDVRIYDQALPEDVIAKLAGL